jgi:hypothetical protein
MAVEGCPAAAVMALAEKAADRAVSERAVEVAGTGSSCRNARWSCRFTLRIWPPPAKLAGSG